MVSGSSGGGLLGYVAALAISAGCVALLLYLPAITARAAVPVLLLSVLVVGHTWGVGPALLACAAVSVGYSFYFLPMASLGTAERWVGFVSFTVSAVLVGELAARAEWRQREALAGRREIERLYQELQAAFDRASKAEAARRNDQLKAALLDALTHNLRAPLTAIKASVTALMGKADRDALDALSVESRRDLLQVIDEESDRLNRFVEGLSAADHPGLSQPLRFRPVPVEDVVGAGLARAQAVTRHHRVRSASRNTFRPLRSMLRRSSK